MANQYTKGKTPITDEQFDEIINQLSVTDKSINSICKGICVSKQSFYDYMRIIGSVAKDRYARAKECQVEIIMDRIAELQEECLKEIRTIDDPKRCNALQSAYREQIRHCEWIASKLQAKKYGDKIDVTSNGESLSRELTVTPVSTGVNTINQDKNQPT